MNINDIIKELNKIDKELLLLERDIYNVIYTDLVEPNKIYISNNKK